MILPASRAFPAFVLALLAAVAPASAQEPQFSVEAPTRDEAAATAAVAQVRRAIDPEAQQSRESRRVFEHFGRPSLEITGRAAGAEAPGEIREYAVFDLATQRLVSFVYFPHASARRSGESILSLGAIAAGADSAVRKLLPGRDLLLDGIQRFRTSGQESVYYEARYAPPVGEVPFLAAPVRLLLDASSGRVFRFEQDPEWPEPARAARALISRAAAERIAALVLRVRDLAPSFGPGAAPGAVGAPELFVVRPNDWLGNGASAGPAGARVAWVVPFRLAGQVAGPAHQLFVDAASGRVLGGAPAPDTAPR